MLELLILLAAVVVLRRQFLAYGGEVVSSAPAFIPSKLTPQVERLADYADRLYAEKKWLAAEKAYLNVLRVDHKNVTAYSHLGIIYSTQKSLADAIECFQIAVRLKPSGSTYQNLGLAYYENRNYMKAMVAIEKAIMFEPTAQRYLGLSKVHRKLGNVAQELTVLERAVALDASRKVLQVLGEAYESAGRAMEAKATRARLESLAADEHGHETTSRLEQPASDGAADA